MGCQVRFPAQPLPKASALSDLGLKIQQYLQLIGPGRACSPTYHLSQNDANDANDHSCKFDLYHSHHFTHCYRKEPGIIYYCHMLSIFQQHPNGTQWITWSPVYCTFLINHSISETLPIVTSRLIKMFRFRTDFETFWKIGRVS